MIKVFYGEDRVRALKEIGKFLGGAGYEVVEGSGLEVEDLPNIFQGTSLLAAGERRILLRDVMKSPAGREIAEYAGTRHRVAILELQPDKREEGWKKLAAAGVEMTEFKMMDVDVQTMFGIYRTAKRDGAAAVKMLEEVREGLEPKVVVGVLAAGAMRDYSQSGQRPKTAQWILGELAKLDMDLEAVASAEASSERKWLLIESFLIRLERKNRKKVRARKVV